METQALNQARERAERARAYFREGYNCAQSVALAFADVVAETPEKVAAAMSGFGGGIGRLREVCGCVSAMTYVASCVRPATHPENQQERKANYALVQDLAESFRGEFGSIVCRDLLGLRKDAKAASPAPSERSAHYYATRPCEEQCGKAAEMLALKLSEINA